ncbi:PilN domain-containing protein [bacterium]|nr:PilN domain-containing protein [bacterium]
MKRIDLIPQEAKRITLGVWIRGQIRSGISKLLAVVIILLAILTLWQMSAHWRYKLAIATQKKKINKLQIQLNNDQSLYTQIEKEKEAIEKKKKYIEQRIVLLEEAQEAKIAWSTALVRLSRLVPQRVWVNKISLNKDVITIEGTTFDHALISRFMSRLDESKYFENTSFNYTQQARLVDQPVVNFEVTTHLLRGL